MKFSPVPNSSYRLIAKKVAESTRMTYTQNALQVNVVNVAIMYDLDTEEAKWVDDSNEVKLDIGEV